MTLRHLARSTWLTSLVLMAAITGLSPAPALAQTAKVRVTGRVLDQQNAVPLPGVPVELVGGGKVVYTDVDGRYVLDVAPGKHDLKVSLGGYQDRTLEVTAAAGAPVTADVSLSLAGFAEEVTVQADVTDATSSTAEAQLIERKRSAVVSDNIGASEMRANNDSSTPA